MSENHIYIAIDLKSFYASAECVERGLDPLTTNLVVADASRTEKTICLAVSPSLKSYGISGRARLFEVESKVKEINKIRILRTDNKKFAGSSFDSTELKENKNLKLDYIKAIPRMAYYMEYSTKIYDIYLKYVAPEDIHVYSIDEVFMDVTHYLKIYNLSPAEFATGFTTSEDAGSCAEIMPQANAPKNANDAKTLEILEKLIKNLQIIFIGGTIIPHIF